MLTTTNAQTLGYARRCTGAAFSLPWKLLRTICSLVQALCRLSITARPPAAPTLSRLMTDRSRNQSKSTPAHDAVVAALLHKYHLSIHVSAGPIQLVYGSPYANNSSLGSVIGEHPLT